MTTTSGIASARPASVGVAYSSARADLSTTNSRALGWSGRYEQDT